MPNTLIGTLSGPAGQGYTWLGQWLAPTAYVPYDTVYQLGSSYNCVVPNTGIDPSGDNGTHWQLMARIGNPGVAGPEGPVGADYQEIGSIKAWPSVVAPATWMIMDGSAVSRTLYPELFALIGTTFGAGDGTTTFNLPDGRSRFILSTGQGVGLTDRLLAATGGEESHILVPGEIASHAHYMDHIHYMDHTHGMDHCHNMDHCHTHDHYHNINFGQINHAHSVSDPTHIHTARPLFAQGATGYASGGGGVSNAPGINAAAVGIGIYTAGFGVGSSYWISQTDGNLINTAYASQTNGAWANTLYASQTNGAWGNTGTASTPNTYGASTPNTGAAGGDGAHNNVPPFLVLTYIVKVSGGGLPTAQAPIADQTQAGLMNQLSGNAGDYVGGDNACHPLIIPIPRSFNSVGNPNFEVDARTAGTGAPNPNSFAMDRWGWFRSGAGGYSGVGQQDASSSPILIPGTNFAISRSFLRFTLSTQQPTLGATDWAGIYQSIEGSMLRELIGDVHSITLLVRSSVAGLTFGTVLQDNAATRALAKLCTIPSANTWTLIPLPNLPIWDPGGNFPLTPGSIGYSLNISLCTGASIMAPANDLWVTGDFYGAYGQSNFAASPVNSTFDIAFVQHEPGPQCSTLLDKPFTQNYDECLRYYHKSLSLPIPPTAAAAQGAPFMCAPISGTVAWNADTFPRPMATVPAITTFSFDNAAAGYVSFRATQGDTTATSSWTTEKKIGLLNLGTAPPPGADVVIYNYVADTAW